MVGGLSRQQAEEQMYELMQEYHPNLPDDLNEDYHIEDIWLPITQGQSKVEVIYPSKLEIEDLDLENVNKLIEKLNEIKTRLANNSNS
jgi:hypothetical protein